LIKQILLHKLKVLS